MAESIKRVVKVTIEQEIEVELTPSVFGNMTHDQYLAEFCSGLWTVDSIEDVVKHAAVMAAQGSIGVEEDGLGLVGYSHSRWPREPDTKICVISNEADAELVD